ncbi:carbohydrate ABC transporter permease [Oceanivirga salmonicida]|uniref:carbohydrate ABC transporter permease n=1 Tax=Oceanivirga salmonicida TaxID=1769291 RepID=UPI000831CC45|nr:carbohydrate ABC transporter permease [Oceanivirga salmonicida]
MKKTKVRLNAISPVANALLEVFFMIFAIVCVVPFLLIIAISLTSEATLYENGFRFIPSKISFDAYIFLWHEKATILKALGVSVGITTVGTILGVLFATTLGYSLSRPNFRLKSLFTYVIFIPMIFNGGLVASFVVNTHLLGLKNSYWALILPICVNSFNVILARSYFSTNIHSSLIESAKIDGATQLQIFTKIVLPLAKPLIATLALFLSFGYWNDWFQAALYISDSSKLPLQAVLNNIQKNIEYLAQNPSIGLTLQEYIRNLPTESMRMAIAVMIIVPIALAYPFFQKYFITGLTVGAIKE